LVVGYWLLVIGCWLLVIGYWLLVVGYWLLVIGYWLFLVRVPLRLTAARGRTSYWLLGGEKSAPTSRMPKTLITDD